MFLPLDVISVIVLYLMPNTWVECWKAPFWWFGGRPLGTYQNPIQLLLTSLDLTILNDVTPSEQIEMQEPKKTRRLAAMNERRPSRIRL